MRPSRQGYWSWLPLPSPGDLPNPGIEPRSPELQADPLLTELQVITVDLCIWKKLNGGNGILADIGGG